ncbi:MAG TPA: hypothetical protein VLY04_09070 [Bryobacteraceae bacterium]|nr:hypothetical protein [Bryobacteraceae bacterium]
MLLRSIGILLLACVSGMAQSLRSINDMVATVRGGLQQNLSDSQIARSLRRIRLAERLDDRTVETLESEGAGPRTMEELMRLRDASSHMPLPLAPAIEEPPPPSPEEQQRTWLAATANAINYSESLPDFICSEVVRRYKDPTGKESFRLSDTLVIRLTYFEHKEDYKLLTVNNRSTWLSYEQTSGAITEGEFGSMLVSIFAPSSQTAYRWDHWTTLRGRPASVYFFRIAASNSSYRMTVGTNAGDRRATTAGQHGYVYVDRDSNMVVRIAATADSIPPDFPVQKAITELDYGFTEVGGRQYLLPLHAATRLDAPPFQHRNEVDFLAYRKFSADATITFGDTPAKK